MVSYEYRGATYHANWSLLSLILIIWWSTAFIRKKTRQSHYSFESLCFFDADDIIGGIEWNRSSRYLKIGWSSPYLLYKMKTGLLNRLSGILHWFRWRSLVQCWFCKKKCVMLEQLLVTRFIDDLLRVGGLLKIPVTFMYNILLYVRS